MRVHVLQHVPFEAPGSIQSWLAERQAVVSHTLFYEASSLPDVGTLDLVIALGGPMSVNDEASLPWLVEEKHFIAAAILAGKAVLGICLGAQLIASALGASVYPGPYKEIGWFGIQATPPRPGVFSLPQEITVFHWHRETFDLPLNAVELARSTACETQAFQYGANVIGLQFHLETTPQSLDALIAHSRHELTGGVFVQSERDMRNVPRTHYTAINDLMAEVLAYLTRGIV